MRRAWWIGAASVLSLAVLGAVLAGPIISSLVADKAARRGFSVEVESVSLGWSGILLRGLAFEDPQAKTAEGVLDSVRVPWGTTVRALYVDGGKVRLRGSVGTLRERLRGGVRTVASDDGTGAARRSYHVQGLSIDWQLEDSGRLRATGMGLERDAGGLRVAADSLSLETPLGEAELEGLRVGVGKDGVVQEFSNERARLQLRLSVAASRELAEDNTKPASEQGGAGALNDSEQEPASGKEPAGGVKTSEPGAEETANSLWSRIGLHLDPQRGKRLRDRLGALVKRMAPRLPRDKTLSLGGIELALQGSDSTVALAPASLELERSGGELKLRFRPGYQAAQGRQVSLDIHLPEGPGVARARIAGGPVSLAELGVKDGNFGLRRPQDARLRLEADVELAADGSGATVSTRGSVLGVSLQHAKISRSELSGISASWEGEGSLQLDGSELDISRAKLKVGAVAVDLNLKLKAEAGRLIVDGQAEIPAVPCQDVYESLPEGLMDGLAGMKFSGAFSWRAGLALDTDALDKIDVLWRMRNRCRVTTIPPEVDPDKFRRPFLHTIRDADGDPMEVWRGPGTRDWVPLGMMSRYMEVAVLTTEDGGFWRHNGFNQRAIENSIRLNLKSGRFARGASTITMQLSRNLYLSLTKTIARKLREALLTMLLEQELQKEQILELYLNVIEYAPGVFGIGPAAQHFFDSVPEELTLAQAMFLGSVLPSPSIYRFESDGSLKAAWQRQLRALMRIAHSRQRLTQLEMEWGTKEELRFGESGE